MEEESQTSKQRAHEKDRISTCKGSQRAIGDELNMVPRRPESLSSIEKLVCERIPEL